MLGNKAVTMVANVLYNCWLADIMTCHKAMRTDLCARSTCAPRVRPRGGDHRAGSCSAGHRVYEVPIAYRARGREEGKKLTGMDAVRVIAILVRERLRR